MCFLINSLEAHIQQEDENLRHRQVQTAVLERPVPLGTAPLNHASLFSMQRLYSGQPLTTTGIQLILNASLLCRRSSITHYASNEQSVFFSQFFLRSTVTFILLLLYNKKNLRLTHIHTQKKKSFQCRTNDLNARILHRFLLE